MTICSDGQLDPGPGTVPVAVTVPTPRGAPPLVPDPDPGPGPDPDPDAAGATCFGAVVNAARMGAGAASASTRLPYA